MSDTSTGNNLTFNKVYDLISGDASESQFRGISGSVMERPWIVDALLRGVSDINPFLTMYSEEQIKEMVVLVILCYYSMFNAFFSVSSGDVKLEELVKKTRQNRYTVNASNGKRVATSGEVSEGIYYVVNDYTVKLVDEPTLFLTEKEEKFIWMMTWALTGRWRYFIQAGYNVKYENGVLAEPEIKYIWSVRNVIYRMCELLTSSDMYPDIVEKLREIKKAGTYKYPDYADDEIHLTDGITFVVNQLNKMMPRYRSGVLAECSRIMYRNKSIAPSSYSTEEKMKLREGYYCLLHPDNSEESAKNDEFIETNRKLCDKIREAVGDGLLENTDFAVKVATTITKNNYRFCSDKQRNVLVDAISRSDKARESKETKQKAEEASAGTLADASSVFSIASISNMLGKGEIE